MGLTGTCRQAWSEGPGRSREPQTVPYALPGVRPEESTGQTLALALGEPSAALACGE